MMLPALLSLDFSNALWIIVVGSVCNVACALLGCFLVLRRMSLLGDAISHGVLPGIAVGFLVMGQITGPGIVIGAMIFGVLTALLTQTLHGYAKTPEDSSMGIVFTSLFAVGVILISRNASGVDLDFQCVLEGLIEGIPLNKESWLGVEVPRALPTMLLSLALTLAFIAVLWKELKIVSFDPALATAMGMRTNLVHYMLMALVAAVTVSSFEAVGSILVVAMLIVPAACGHLLSDRLAGVLIWAAAAGVLSAILGCLLAPEDAKISGMMAVSAGGLFLLTALFAPRHGILARLIRNARLALRIVREDILATLYRREEGTALTPAAVVPPSFTNRLALALLRFKGHVASADGTIILTGAGRERARSLVRAHRLWEAYLDRNFELPPDHLHAPATQMEHFLGPALQSELDAELRRPGTDPHGRVIPPPL
jgi:manganese/zinc/iron transport system permease protein